MSARRDGLLRRPMPRNGRGRPRSRTRSSSTLRRFGATCRLPPRHLSTWCSTITGGSSELALRHLIDRLTDPVVRGELQLLADAAGDDRMIRLSRWSTEGYLLEVFSLGREVAMARVRGQDLEPTVADRLRYFEGLAEHAQELREIERDA